jgi:hypothetical protein
MAKDDEFKFPDEQEVKASKDEDKVEFEIEGENTETEVEVVDDTPAQDRGRKPMDEPPKEFAEDELTKYDESVQRRIKHFTKGYHEERRAKEAAEREREEALRIAQTVVEENKKLKGSLNSNQQVLLEQAKKVVGNEVEKAKAKYKEAYESGDSDAIVNAQEELITAKSRMDRVNNFKPAPLQQEETEVQIPQQVTKQPPVDQKALAWQSENKWFGSDDEMTSFALGLHTKLVKSGVDPQSNEYYEKLNSRVRQVFPEQFESEKPVDAPPPPKKSNVAPATRSTAPKKIVLTQTQVNIAKRLGVPLDLYARKVAEEQLRK